MVHYDCAEGTWVGSPVLVGIHVLSALLSRSWAAEETGTQEAESWVSLVCKE